MDDLVRAFIAFVNKRGIEFHDPGVGPLSGIAVELLVQSFLIQWTYDHPDRRMTTYTTAERPPIYLDEE